MPDETARSGREHGAQVESTNGKSRTSTASREASGSEATDGQMADKAQSFIGQASEQVQAKAGPALSQAAEKAQQFAGQAMDQASDRAQEFAAQAPESMYQASYGMMRQFETWTVENYYAATFASLGASIILLLLGRRSLAAVIGLWTAILLNLGLFSRMLHEAEQSRSIRRENPGSH